MCVNTSPQFMEYFCSYFVFITARKRSLGQGNIFIGMCQEFCSQGGCLLLGGASSWRGCVLWGCFLLEGGASSGGVLPSGGCLLLWGGASSRGVPAGDLPPGWLLLRAVRILLECILVLTINRETSARLLRTRGIKCKKII